MRSAALCIQPSRFEGWSTPLEDAKAIGRPVACSNLPVHLEQAPDALGFFGCDEPDRLAYLLVFRWSTLTPGPDFGREQRAIDAEREIAASYGTTVLGLCREAVPR